MSPVPARAREDRLISRSLYCAACDNDAEPRRASRLKSGTKRAKRRRDMGTGGMNLSHFHGCGRAPGQRDL